MPDGSYWDVLCAYPPFYFVFVEGTALRANLGAPVEVFRMEEPQDALFKNGQPNVRLTVSLI